jgi:Icc-related predicted phosphoesterase
VGLLRRRRGQGEADGVGAVRLYYASDIHGTETLWRKFLHAARVYEAGVLVMGGDVTGKVVVPLVEDGGAHVAELFGRAERAGTGEELDDLERRIRANGMYPHRMSSAEVGRVAALSEEAREAWFAEVMLVTFERWLALAEARLADAPVRCFVMPGNDDPPAVDGAIERAARVEGCDGRVVEFGGYRMVSVGYSNRTPFDSPRELDEDELYRRICGLADEAGDMDRCLFNLHVPPYDSTLDTCAALDDHLEVVMAGSEPKLIAAGSTAVREAIERYQPLASLHGHIHESAGATRIGRTLCINPGSDYHTGRIAGCLLQLRGGGVRHQFVTG